MNGGAFGFEVPQGNPGTIDAAAGSWRALAAALGTQGEAVAAGTQVALGAGGWEGSAAGTFAGSSERLIKAFTADVEVAGQAAAAMSELARALEQAQQVTRQALAECERSQAEATTQQAAADRAGAAAQSAQRSASTAVHPTVVTAFARQAAEAEQQQIAAQGAVTQAQGALTAARTRGIQAVTSYEHQAQAVTARLRAAAGELRNVPDLGHGWAEPVVTWVGHVNDFMGAGAVGLLKGYDQAVSLAAGSLISETEQVLASPLATARVMAGLDPGIATSDTSGLFDYAANQEALAASPLTKVLSTGLPEDTFGVLGKVPYLAAGVTAFDMFLNRNEGVGKGVIEPVGNLVTGTVITEASAPVVAAGITSLTAEGGALAALGSTAIIPGVGEVVIVGGIAVVGTWAVDKGVTWVWDHGGAQVASDAWHGVEHGANWVYDQGKSAVNTVESAGSWALNQGESLANDANSVMPWNWG